MEAKIASFLMTEKTDEQNGLHPNTIASLPKILPHLPRLSLIITFPHSPPPPPPAASAAAGVGVYPLQACRQRCGY